MKKRKRVGRLAQAPDAHFLKVKVSDWHNLAFSCPGSKAFDSFVTREARAEFPLSSSGCQEEHPYDPGSGVGGVSTGCLWHLTHIPSNPHRCAILALKTPINMYELPQWLRP